MSIALRMQILSENLKSEKKKPISRRGRSRRRRSIIVYLEIEVKIKKVNKII